jgi:hypothetical protein
MDGGEPEEESSEEVGEQGEAKNTETTTVMLLGTGKYGDSDQGIKNPLAKTKDVRPAGVDGWEFKASPFPSCIKFVLKLLSDKKQLDVSS